MKNIVLVVIDGLPYREINDRRMPFFSQLIEKSVCATKAYSQAAYTESSMMSLLFNGNTFDNGGYFSGMLESENNIIELFVNKGYDVFIPFFWWVLPPKSLRKTTWKTCDLKFSSFLRMKLDYYYDLYQSTEIKPYDLGQICKLIEDIWDIFEVIIDSRDEYLKTMCSIGVNTSDEIINTFDMWIKKALENKDSYYRDKKKYINTLFDNYLESFLLSECNFDFFEMNDTVVYNLQTTYNEYQKRIIKCRRKFITRNLFRAIRNFCIHGLKYAISKKGSLQKKFQYSFCYNTYRDFLMKNTMWQFLYPKVYRNESGTSMIMQFDDWLNQRINDKPYFTYIHLDDWRGYSSITRGAMSMDQTSSEVDKAVNLMETLLNDSGYSGMLDADLSLMHVDECISELYRVLKRQNDFKDTIIIFTADHGKSNELINQRERLCNNFFDESYHVPFIINGSGINPRKLERFVLSSDIFATIADLGDIEVQDIEGTSVFNEAYGREFVSVEYGGSGVPDLSRRPLIFGYRDEEINIVYQVHLSGKFEEGKIVEVYDLIKDPREKCNLVARKKYNEKMAREKLESLRARFERIKAQYFFVVLKDRHDAYKIS